MSLTDRTRPVVLSFTRLMNQWRAYDQRGHDLAGERFTAGELQIMKVVAELPGHNTTELADALGITKGAVSQAVSKLVKRGIVERYRAPDNDRESFTRLTARGAAAYREHMSEAEEQIEAFDALLAEADPEHVDFMLDFVGKAEQFFREQSRATRGG